MSIKNIYKSIERLPLRIAENTDDKLSQFFVCFMSKRSLISGRGHSRNYDNCDGKNVSRNFEVWRIF